MISLYPVRASEHLTYYIYAKSFDEAYNYFIVNIMPEIKRKENIDKYK